MSFPHLRLLAAYLEQHFSRKIISQVNKCEFLIRLSLWLSSIRQVFLSPFWIRSSKKLFQPGIKLVQLVSASGNVQLYNYALSIRLKELTFLVITWVGYTITRVTYRRQDIIIIVHGLYFWKSLDFKLIMFIWQLLTATSVRCTAGELGNLGRVHHNQGHLKKARDYYNRARAIFFEKAWAWPCSCGNYLQQSESPGSCERLLSSCIRHST